MPLYRELGDGDAMKGFDGDATSSSYQELNKKLHDSGHAHPVSCVDCHDPETMQLRVTRPGFINGIQALAASDAPVPHLPSDRALARRRPREALRPQRRRARAGDALLRLRPVPRRVLLLDPRCRSSSRGTRACGSSRSETYWNETKFPDGDRFFDWKHAETGAPILKAQHPEFEMWSQGIHARSGVACADCHMPYMREGAIKVSDHWVRSPLLNVNRACQTCHHVPEEEIKARVDAIQAAQLRADAARRRGDRGAARRDRRGEEAEGATDAQLQPALELQRKAQWRLDFVAAENSMGFHAPQEAARVLGEAIDYARQGELAAARWTTPVKAAAAAPARTDGERAKKP